MKKGILLGLIVSLLLSLAVLVSSAAGDSNTSTSDRPLTYGDYFSEERRVKKYNTLEKSAVYTSHRYVSLELSEYYRLSGDWQGHFTAAPEGDMIYIIPPDGTKYEPLIDINGQDYSFVLDTLYYVTADGWIVARDLVSEEEVKIVRPEGEVFAMEASIDLLFYEVDRKLYRVYLPENRIDFFMDLSPYSPWQEWSVFSNQSVCVYFNGEKIYYNREEECYYSDLGLGGAFLVARGEENKVPSSLSSKRVPYDENGIVSRYGHLIRTIPDASYSSIRTEYGHILGYDNSNMDIFFQELAYAGILRCVDPSYFFEMEEDDSPCISKEMLQEVYERTFGPGSFEKFKSKEILSSSYGEIVYNTDHHDYHNAYFVNPNLKQNPDIISRVAYTDVSDNGSEIILKVRRGVASLEVSSKVRLFGSGSSKAFSIIPEVEDFRKDPDSAYNRLLRGEYDEYFPLYAVTFLSNGDGTYHWKSTELLEGGTPVPGELFPVKAENVNTDTSTVAPTDTSTGIQTNDTVGDASEDVSSDTSTGDTVDASADVSTLPVTDSIPPRDTSATDSVPDSDVNPAEGDKASLWPWIMGGAILLVGIGGVALLLWKGKKKE